MLGRRALWALRETETYFCDPAKLLHAFVRTETAITFSLLALVSVSKPFRASLTHHVRRKESSASRHRTSGPQLTVLLPCPCCIPVLSWDHPTVLFLRSVHSQEEREFRFCHDAL